MDKKLNKHLQCIIFLCLTSVVFAQKNNCDCKEDLASLNEKIIKSPAYKLNKEAYEKSYAKALNEVKTIVSDHYCFIALNRLMISLNDNHSKIYGIEEGATAEILKNDELVAAFKESALYSSYIKPNINLDSLSKTLSVKNTEDIEGIYIREKYMTLGVYKNLKTGDYNAIILDSKSKIWQKGELMYTLIPYGNNYLLNIGGSIISKRKIAYTERIKNGIFLTMGFKKQGILDNHTVPPYPDETYYREEISPDITYLKIGSFSSWHPTLGEAETFYKTLEESLTKKYLIIDLRDNGGGGNRNSDLLLKILKKYAAKNKTYVITNHRTASNAEQFTIKLKELKNITTYGDRTNGSLAFEIKNGNHKLSCDNYIAVLSSKKHKKFLPFESKGINPDIMLETNKSWIEQIVEIIEN